MWSLDFICVFVFPSLPRKTPNKVNSRDPNRRFVHDVIFKTLSCAPLLHPSQHFLIGEGIVVS